MKSTENETTGHTTNSSRKWPRYVLHVLAATGLLAIVAVAYGFYTTSPNSEPLSIDETETIEAVMTNTYGKYSETQKGWLYVGEYNRTFLMRVVQQAKISGNGTGNGDSLYFVASGNATDGSRSAIYGIFQIRWDGTGKERKLYQISSAYQRDSDVAPTPEMVRLEKLSPDVWGWFIKTRSGKDAAAELVREDYTIYAPNGDAIANLGSIPASFQRDPGMDCAAANQRYEEWAHPAAQAATVPANSPSPENATVPAPEIKEQEEIQDEEGDNEPPRCSKAQWTYHLEAASGKSFSSIHISGKGLKDGQPLDEKTYKIMFDNKSFVYLIPDSIRYM